MANVYLSQNVKLEPLIDNWYAWPHLIPPSTAARNLTERHLRIMQSYVSAPQVHANAVKNPKMLGGPFIDFKEDRTSEVRELMEKTKNDSAILLKLSEALNELDRMLSIEASGNSLQNMYPQIPALLKGFVELYYDRNNSPSFRLIEPLIYKSQFYNDKNQSIMLSKIDVDDRPFVLSTPRLKDEISIKLDIPFSDAAIDHLFKSKSTPQTLESMFDVCRVQKDDQNLFSSFFTEVPPKRYLPYTGDGIRWRYFGHACILVETADVSILFDPVLSYTYESSVSRFTYEDLPDHIDYVVITHNHQDHVLLETLLQIRHKTSYVVVPRNGGGALEDPSLRLMLEQIGFPRIVELDEFQSIEIPNGKLLGIPFLGEHADLNIRSKLAYLLEYKGEKLCFAADSCNIQPELYKHIHKCTGDVRALFVGMECDGAPLSWLYGPLMPRRLDRAQDESRRLSGSNCSQAIDIVDTLKCKEVFVYAMGQEPWLRYIMSLVYTLDSNPIVQSNSFLELCRERGALAERLFGEREMLL